MYHHWWCISPSFAQGGRAANIRLMAKNKRAPDSTEPPAGPPSPTPDEFEEFRTRLRSDPAFDRRRWFKLTDRPQIRSQGSTRFLEGHASVFGVRTQLYSDLEEQVAPGCFTETIQRDDIRALFNHDPNMILGRNVAKTLEMHEDSVGLAFRVSLGNQTYANNLAESIDRGDIDQCSFGFQTEDDSFDRSVSADGSKTVVRTLRKCTLFDVGPVTYAQYPQAKVTARSQQQPILRLDDIPIGELLEARARLESGADDPAAAALIRRAMRALATVAGPTPQERMKSMQQRMALALRAV